VNPDSLSILDAQMRKVVEPGWIDILVGANSAETSSGRRLTIAE
jgi:hypothetical protein